MTGDAGYSIMNHIISEGRVPSAIFCINDPIAMGAMKALLDAGIKVPEDVSIIGFNDVDLHYQPFMHRLLKWEK